ncbi:MAG: hypothetical protein ACREM8_14605 [Vulcanimicrobiaceae bacterium]
MMQLADKELIRSAAHDWLAEHCGELDAYIAQVGSVSALADDDLRRIAVRLPTMLYALTSLLVDSTIYSDVARAVGEYAWHQHYAACAEKAHTKCAAYADGQADPRAEIAAKAILVGVRARLDAAIAVQDGVKKVISARDMDRQVFRREVAR